MLVKKNALVPDALVPRRTRFARALLSVCALMAAGALAVSK
jgi:hypothetical protein